MAKQATGSAREAVVETRDADEFATVLKQSFKPRSDRAASEVENAVTTLVREALADTTVIKDDVLDTIEEMIARLDEKLTAQVNAIIHAPEFQQIESAWRGLHYLVFNSETDANLKIRVMNVSKNEIYRNLRLYPGARWDQSPLFKAVYEAEFGQLGGEPFGCLIGDYYFSHLPTDVQLLRDLSKVVRLGPCAVLCRRRSDFARHGQLDRARQSARHRQDLRYAGICGLERAARPGRFALCRAVHAARARAPALWREVGPGRGIRLRGGYRRPQGRESTPG